MSWILLVKKVTKGAHVVAPVALERMQPVVHLSERKRFKVIEALTPARLLTDQAGLSEHMQMLRNGRAPQFEPTDKVIDGPRPVTEFLQKPAPHRVRQCSEHVTRHVMTICR